MIYEECTPSLEDAVRLASLGFHQSITEALTNDVAQHLADADFCVCIEDEGRLVGLQLCHLPLPRVLYIGGTLIEPGYQGEGIKAEATRRVFEARRDLVWFAGRTQSPIVWSSVRRIASELLPHRPHESASPEATLVRDQLVQALGMMSAIQPGFYGGPLYGEKPIHRDPEIQAWWDSFCRFERGDAVLYVARP